MGIVVFQRFNVQRVQRTTLNVLNFHLPRFIILPSMSHPMSLSEIHSSDQQSSIVRVCGRYRVGKLLGCGTFGESLIEFLRLYSIPT